MGRYGIAITVAALAVVAAGCAGVDTSAPRPTGAPPTTVTVAPTSAAASEPTAQTGTGNGSGQNGGGSDGGGPTRPTTTTPTGVPYDPNVRCTDKVNYAGDPRSNAEINSIGERTGTCPAPQR